MNRKIQKPMTTRSKKLNPQLPFGYQQDPRTRSIVIVSEQARLIKQIFKTHSSKRK